MHCGLLDALRIAINREIVPIPLTSGCERLWPSPSERQLFGVSDLIDSFSVDDVAAVDFR